MRTLILMTALLAAIAPGGVSALSIDLTVEPVDVISLGPVTFNVGIVETGTSSGVDLNGYTLDYSFDSTELTFVAATQLVSFGNLGQLDFSSLGDCMTGRCTAGNTPGEDAITVTNLFALEFNVDQIINDGVADLSIGILNSVFNDVTQRTGGAPFTKGTVVANAFVVPEPATALMLGLGVTGLALGSRRRPRALSPLARTPRR